MSANIKKQLARLNQQYKEIDAVYHAAAVRLGLSDCVFWILYVLCESGQQYTQNDLADEWFFPKQTINSAIGNLVKSSYVCLESIPGTRGRKAICLTGEGVRFCERNIKTVIAAEQRAFERLSADERQTYLLLADKHLGFLKEEAEKL